jgi:Fe2+ or Zn2+ uptake regulation protein
MHVGAADEQASSGTLPEVENTDSAEAYSLQQHPFFLDSQTCHFLCRTHGTFTPSATPHAINIVGCSIDQM